MDVRLPNLGEGAESGTVVSVLVKEGDRIEKGQSMVELENEKAVAPIPAPAAGTVRSIRVKQGDRLSVGQMILTLEEGGQAAPAAAPAKQKVEKPQEQAAAQPEEQAEEEEAPAAEPTESSATPAAAPSIRRLARDLGIDLRLIKGSESGGRIVLSDVRAFIQRLLKQSGGVAKKAAAAPASTEKVSIDFAKWGSVSRQSMSLLRQTISRRMAESWTTIPHVTQFDEADVTGLMELRKRHAAAYEKAGAKLTLTSFALKAVVSTLQKHPIFNSSLDEGAHEVVFKQYFHIGLAVDTEHGLFVPVLRDVDRKNLLVLSREIKELAEKARGRKLSMDDMQGGSFTISNQGGIGGGHFTPIINRPEVAILGLGRGVTKPVAVEGQVALRTMLPLALSYDHRVIDGGSAARFITDLVAALQTFPETELKF